MQKVKSSTAYICWCLCFFGISGGQRFYVGNVAGGLIYLFTFGVFGVGQLLDLVLIPRMVDRRNTYLRGLDNQYIPGGVTLNVGTLPNVPQPSATGARQGESANPLHQLLTVAHENGGTLSLAQATLLMKMEPAEVKQLLHEAELNDLAEIGNDPETGAIRYYFDL